MIIIPSIGRSDLRNATVDMLIEAGFSPVLVVPRSEALDYQLSYRGARIVHHPDELKGLPTVMQWCVDRLVKGVVIFMDDDLVLYNRFDGTTRLPRNSPEETRETVRWLYDSAMKYGHATISPTQFNNAHEDDEEFCCAARSVLAYDMLLIKRLSIRFDRVPSKNDYDVTLQLFRAGYKNVCAFNLCHKQVAGPNLRGGCTPYRNEELHERASKRLAELHPDFVKVVIKTKPQWKFPRHDVIVRWKKAYESSL